MNFLNPDHPPSPCRGGIGGGGIILKMIPLCNIIIDIFILISTVYYKEDINLVLKLILPLKGVLNLRRLYKFEFLVELILTSFFVLHLQLLVSLSLIFSVGTIEVQNYLTNVYTQSG